MRRKAVLMLLLVLLVTLVSLYILTVSYLESTVKYEEPKLTLEQKWDRLWDEELHNLWWKYGFHEYCIVVRKAGHTFYIQISGFNGTVYCDGQLIATFMIWKFGYPTELKIYNRTLLEILLSS